jgi:hypothetical protein
MQVIIHLIMNHLNPIYLLSIFGVMTINLERDNH